MLHMHVYGPCNVTALTLHELLNYLELCSLWSTTMRLLCIELYGMLIILQYQAGASCGIL